MIKKYNLHNKTRVPERFGGKEVLEIKKIISREARVLEVSSGRSYPKPERNKKTLSTSWRN